MAPERYNNCGLKQKAIHRRKGLKKSQKILDHMGSTELAANLFRATQAEESVFNRIIGDSELSFALPHS